MNKVIRFATSFAIALFFCACGDEAEFEIYDDVDVTVSTLSDLYEVRCVAKKDEGKVAYIQKSDVKRVCLDGEWEYYNVDVVRNGSSRDPFAYLSRDTIAKFDFLPACNEKRDSMVFFVESIKKELICLDEEWLEISLQKISTYVSYKSNLPECHTSLNGAVVYVNENLEDMICSDGSWVELDNWLQSSSSSFDGSSSSASSSSSSRVSVRDWAFGICDESRQGEVVFDSNGYVNYYNDDYNESDYDYYECIDGEWENASDDVIDTLGWLPGEEGMFRGGRVSQYNLYSSLPDYCLTTGEEGKRFYVFENESWRKATLNEVCFAQSCTRVNENETFDIGGKLFLCSESQWNEVEAVSLVEY